MGKKRKHTETQAMVSVSKKEEDAPERPTRTLLGWKDNNEVINDDEVKDIVPPFFQNKEKVLVTCSRRINYRYRNSMLNVVSVLPRCKKDNKVESKETKGATLNELVKLKNCSSCLFFECRKAKDLYFWMAKCPNDYFMIISHCNVTHSPVIILNQISVPRTESDKLHRQGLDKMTLVEA
ncbi:PREDICTED: ribosome biogenesis protein BRX1-like [Lupinus angustifolius]|uniref:ribosome biogenesis protein BRX1-like n=1 Tax=Lupinus angustifolius TaxID=3871 RepID=UPI00092F8D53|nr:PREDICTED: ribosome biogenesis protein BRX1-like [Lupinus angustifolius]